MANILTETTRGIAQNPGIMCNEQKSHGRLYSIRRHLRTADLEQSLTYRIAVTFLFAIKSNHEPDKVPYNP